MQFPVARACGEVCDVSLCNGGWAAIQRICIQYTVIYTNFWSFYILDAMPGDRISGMGLWLVAGHGVTLKTIELSFVVLLWD